MRIGCCGERGVTGCLLVLVRRDAPAPGPPPRALVRGLATVHSPAFRQPESAADVALACASFLAHALCAHLLARDFFARPPFGSCGLSGRCRQGTPCNLSWVVLVRPGKCARFSSRPRAANGRRPVPVPPSTHPYSSTRPLLVAAAAASRPTTGSWSSVSGDSGGRVAFEKGVSVPSPSVPCVAVAAGRAVRRLPQPAAAARFLQGAIYPIAAAGSLLSGHCARFFPRLPVRAAAASVDAGCGQCLPPARTASGRLGPPVTYKRAAAAALCNRKDPHETRGQDREANRAEEESTSTRGAVGGSGRPPPRPLPLRVLLPAPTTKTGGTSARKTPAASRGPNAEPAKVERRRATRQPTTEPAEVERRRAT